MFSRSTPPGARTAPSSQEDEWRLMVNQDPCPDSVAGDSGHGTMAMNAETEPAAGNEELIGTELWERLMRTPPLNTILMSNGMMRIY